MEEAEPLIGHIDHEGNGEDFNDNKFDILCYDTEKNTWEEKKVFREKQGQSMIGS